MEWLQASFAEFWRADATFSPAFWQIWCMASCFWSSHGEVAWVTQHSLPFAPSLESGCELLVLPGKTENCQAAVHNVFWISSESRLGLSQYLWVLFPTGAGSGFLCHILLVKFETTESKRSAQSLGIMHPATWNPLLSLTQLNNYGCRNPKISACMSAHLAMWWCLSVLYYISATWKRRAQLCPLLC